MMIGYFFRFFRSDDECLGTLPTKNNQLPSYNDVFEKQSEKSEWQ